MKYLRISEIMFNQSTLERLNVLLLFQQMVYTEEAIYLICKLKRSPEMTSECYERTLQALHVTLADIVRGKHKVSSFQTAFTIKVHVFLPF